MGEDIEGIEDGEDDERVDRAGAASRWNAKKIPAFEPDLWSMASLTFRIKLRISSCSVRLRRCVAACYSLLAAHVVGIGVGGDIWRHIEAHRTW